MKRRGLSKMRAKVRCRFKQCGDQPYDEIDGQVTTYRPAASELTPQVLQRDIYNRLLRAARAFGMDAEIIRDNALAVSGLRSENWRRKRSPVSTGWIVGSDWVWR